MKVHIGRYRKNDKKRKIKIKLDPYDTWSMDHTLALIVHPMLIQLKETKHGSAFVELDDVPPNLRYTDDSEGWSQIPFDFYTDVTLCKQNIQCDVHSRWDWVLDEMIWAFEQVIKDDDGEFYDHSECDKKAPVMEQVKMIKVDSEGLTAYHDRIKNGLRLFGKYYQGLWD